MSESHQHTVDSRYENVPTDHLDRAWPDTGRNASEQVAATRAWRHTVRSCRLSRTLADGRAFGHRLRWC